MKVGDYGRLHSVTAYGKQMHGFDHDPIVEIVKEFTSEWSGQKFLARDIITGAEYRIWNIEVTQLNAMEVLAWVSAS